MQCPHLSICPGCPRFGQPGVPESAQERLDAFARERGVSAEFHQGEARGYRQRARLAVRGSVRHPKIGIFQARSHRAVDIAQCPVHAEAINVVADGVRRAITETQVTPYDDHSHRGVLRYLQLVVERQSGLVQLVLVANAQDKDCVLPLARHLTGQELPLHSVFFNGQPGRTNTIIGPYWDRLSGDPFVVERLCGAEICFPPGAFGQANLNLFEVIAQQVHDWVGQGQRVLELYSGVGAIGLGLLNTGNQVVFNELSPFGIEGLQHGLARLPAHLANSASVCPGTAKAACSAVGEQQFDCVIVDPPRKGVEPEVLSWLQRTRVSQLIYISCGLDSFLRDAEQLGGSGYQLNACHGYALFPFTEHVETVARFSSV